MNQFRWSLVAVFFLLGLALVLAKPEKRVHEGKVSDQEHFSKTGEHNPAYDHDAFLGADMKATFDKLTPEESKRRLGKIVDRMDKNKDQRISLQEMKEWMNYAGNRYVFDDAKRLWKAVKRREAHEATLAKKPAPSANAPITWDVYKMDAFGPEIKANQEKRYQRDRKRWEAADRNKDDKISKDEYPALIHPQVFEHMQDLVLEETMLELDTNKDGYISVDEFLEDYIPSKNRKGTKQEQEDLQIRREEFIQHRDTNKDGRMDKNEARDYIFPSHDHLAAEAQHLISEVDANKDGMLTKKEVMDNVEKFVSSSATEYGNAFNRIEEF